MKLYFIIVWRWRASALVYKAIYRCALHFPVVEVTFCEVTFFEVTFFEVTFYEVTFFEVTFVEDTHSSILLFSYTRPS